MIQSIFKTILLITAVQFFLFGSCNKNDTRPCLNGGYVFIVNCIWSPQKEIYYVGDTIYLTSIIPKTLTDQINTSIIVDYSNSVGIGGDIGIAVIDSVLKQNKPARDSFIVTGIDGSFLERPINKTQGINFSYIESANSYQFKGGFICKKKGIYAFGVADLISKGIRGKDCTNASFNITVTNSDKHLQLYQNLLGITLDTDAIKRGYCFRVQ